MNPQLRLVEVVQTNPTYFVGNEQTFFDCFSKLVKTHGTSVANSGVWNKTFFSISPAHFKVHAFPSEEHFERRLTLFQLFYYKLVDNMDG